MLPKSLSNKLHGFSNVRASLGVTLFLIGITALSVTVLSGCADMARQFKSGAQPAKTVKTVVPVAETDPVDSGDDAADDPEIWVNAQAPSQSLILGTDKKAGLAVYDLNGRRVQFLPRGRLNNVDLRYAFAFGDRVIDIAAASNRTHNTIDLFSIHRASGEVAVLLARGIATGMPEVYGLCMYHSRQSGDYFVYINDKSGLYQQWQLRAGEEGIQAEKVREFSLQSQPEGCVADDETGVLYVGEEAAGLWKLPAEPDAAPRLTRVDGVENGRLVADVEGMSLYASAEGQGYLVVSSQGDNTYAVYDRFGDNPYIGSFRVADNAEKGIDGSAETDGLAVTGAPLGPNFPRGLLVVQDGYNRMPVEQQNFKLVDWVEVERALGLGAGGGGQELDLSK